MAFFAWQVVLCEAQVIAAEDKEPQTEGANL